MKRTPRTRHDDRGGVALEFVLILPVLIMLIFGTLIVGNYMLINAQASNTARAGARAAALRLGLPTGATVVGAPCPTPTDPTQWVTVQATQANNLQGVPFTPIALPATVTESVTM